MARCCRSRKRVARILAAIVGRFGPRRSAIGGRSGGSLPARPGRRPTCRPGTTARWTATPCAPRTSPRRARIGRSCSGESARRRRAMPPTVAVRPGTAIRIATGAPLPAGADAVVQVELTTPLDADGRPRPAARPPGGRAASRRGRDPRAGAGRGASIRRRGSDLAEGSVVLAPAAPSGRPRSGWSPGPGVARVARPSPAARRGAGDRRRGPGGRDRPSAPSGIPDANGPGLRALATAAGRRGDRPRDCPRPARRRPRAPAARDRRGGPRDRQRRRLGRARTTSSGRPSRRSARSTSGGSPSSRASRSPSGRPPAGRHGRSSCSACPATRCRAS